MRKTKKTKPTTVRFKPELDTFVKSMSRHHHDGQSGVINDAVEFYKKHLQHTNGETFHAVLGGSTKSRTRTKRIQNRSLAS